MLKSQNDYMKEWHDGHRKTYEDHLLAHHALLNLGICSDCGRSKGWWRCADSLCRACCQDAHRYVPFHRIDFWNGQHYEQDWLANLGVVMYLGHGGTSCMGVPVPIVEGARPNVAGPLCRVYGSPSGTRDVPDQALCKLMTIGHTTGIHKVWVYFCRCTDRAPRPDVLLLSAGLYPLSYDSPQSAFTFQLLDAVHIANLECKTSIYHYYKMLRRITSPTFPGDVDDRYRELIRANRQWRNLKLQKWAGCGHGVTGNGPGAQALFCSTCPRPGINIPNNWKEDPIQGPYMRVLVLDGNFTASHRKQDHAKPESKLTDGELFLVNEGKYQEHLARAKEDKPIPSKCNQHHAVNDRFTKQKGKDITGIGATACARHGCFCPGSVVGFQLGEK